MPIIKHTKKAFTKVCQRTNEEGIFDGLAGQQRHIERPSEGNGRSVLDLK